MTKISVQLDDEYVMWSNEKVHQVGKLVFPNAVEIGRGDRKEH